MNTTTTPVYTLDEAVKIVEEGLRMRHVDKYGEPEPRPSVGRIESHPLTCAIELWQDSDTEKYGIRVAEVDFSTGVAGSAIMQVEPECLGAIAAVERLLIELTVDMTVGAVGFNRDEEIASAWWRVEELIFGDDKKED